MTPYRLYRLPIFCLFLLLSLGRSWGHDLMASYVIARMKPDRLELQIKVAADSIWPLVQQVSPGAVFAAEDFESVGRPLLLTMAKSMDELAIDGKIVPPTRMEVLMVDDTFLFAFTYPLPARGTIQLKENYLAKMAPDYASHIRLFDGAGTLVDSKSLAGGNRTFAINLPLSKPSASAAPAQAENAAGAVTKP